MPNGRLMAVRSKESPNSQFHYPIVNFWSSINFYSAEVLEKAYLTVRHSLYSPVANKSQKLLHTDFKITAAIQAISTIKSGE